MEQDIEKQKNSSKINPGRFSVAPMMDWTGGLKLR
jgi:hypothetical protein